MIKDFSQVHGYYSYYPSKGGNAAGLAVTCLLLVAQTVLGLFYKQWWMLISWFIGIALSVVGYILRTRASMGYFSATEYKVQYAFFIVAPAFIMAGVYFQMSKVLTVYGLHFARFKPMFYTGVFIGCDVISILIQAGASGAAVSDNEDTANIGRWIMVGGIGFQVVSMLWFIYLFLRLVVKVYRSGSEAYDPQYQHVRDRKMFPFMIPAVFLAWLFVFIRSVYRLVELGQGWRGYLAVHERYFLTLEGLMMILGMAALTVFYPGFCCGRDLIAVKGLTKTKHKTRSGDFKETSLDQEEWGHNVTGEYR